MIETDVAVIGAGVVGAAIARELTRLGAGVTLVERYATPARGGWIFAVTRFVDGATLEVLDGDRVVHRQRCRRLVPNRVLHLDWRGAPDGPLRFRLAR